MSEEPKPTQSELDIYESAAFHLRRATEELNISYYTISGSRAIGEEFTDETYALSGLQCHMNTLDRMLYRKIEKLKTALGIKPELIRTTNDSEDTEDQ